MFKKNSLVKLDKTMCSIYDSSRMVKSRPVVTDKPSPWTESHFPDNHVYEQIEFTPAYFFNPYEMKMAREVLQEIKRLIRNDKYIDFNYEDLKNEEFEIKARDFVKRYYPGLSHSKTEGKISTFNRTMYKLGKFTVTLLERESGNMNLTALFKSTYNLKKTNTWKFKIPILMQIVRFDKARHEDLFLLNYENKYFEFENYEKLSQLALQIVLYLTSKYERSHGKIKTFEIDLKSLDFLSDLWHGFEKLSPQVQKNKKSQIRKALKELSTLDSHSKFVKFHSTNKISILF